MLNQRTYPIGLRMFCAATRTCWILRSFCVALRKRELGPLVDAKDHFWCEKRRTHTLTQGHRTLWDAAEESKCGWTFILKGCRMAAIAYTAAVAGCFTHDLPHTLHVNRSTSVNKREQTSAWIVWDNWKNWFSRSLEIHRCDPSSLVLLTGNIWVSHYVHFYLSESRFKAP